MKTQKNSILGLLLILCGSAFLWQAQLLEIGTIAHTGAGFFPSIISVLCIAVGFFLLITPDDR